MNEHKKTKGQAIGNLLFVGIFILILLAGFVRTVFLPKDINYYENRYCNKIAEPSVDGILNGTFQTSIEEALTDQVFGAQTLKKFYNKMNSFFSDAVVTSLINGQRDTYINFKNGTKIFNGYYVYAPYDFETIKDQLTAKADNYNAYFEAYPQLDFYVYFVEKDTDINFETGEKLNADEYLFSLLNLDESRMHTFEVNSFRDFAENFYKTDHHWKHIGSYKGYTELVALLNCEGKPLERGAELLISEAYMGTKGAVAVSEHIMDRFCVYSFDFPAFRQIRTPGGSDYGAQKEYIDNPNDSVSYGYFYGGDSGLVVFETGHTQQENLLVIGDSFDNAVLKLLAGHFNETHCVDLRNFKAHTGSDFSFGAYVAEHQIDKVLFIGNVDFYTMDTFELEN